MRRTARLLVLGGVICAVLALGKLHAAYVADTPYDFTGSSRFAWSLLLIGTHAGAAYALGLPDIVRSRRQAVATALAASGAASVLVSVAQVAFGDAYLPRFVVGGTALLVVGWYSLCVELASAGRAIDAERDRVVVVGSWADASDLRRELEQGAERHARIVDVLTVHEARPTGDGRRPLVEAVEMGEATVVVLDREAQADESVVDQVAELHESGTRVRTLSLFYEQWLGKLPVAELERVSLMFDIGELHRARFGRLKRIADVAVAIALLPVLAVVTVVVAVANQLGNRGPLMFRQERVGRHGRPFTILKFRTMRACERDDGDGAGEWTAPDDDRITRLGGLLRRSHLDELPQVVNVLRGDLSIVGPRPEQTAYVEELAVKLPFYRMRHLVRPGVTGWAQVKFGYAASESDALEKLQYEFYYLRHQSLSMDARILARTVRQVVRRGGR